MPYRDAQNNSVLPNSNGNGQGKDTSVDWPPLFVGPAKGVYKHQVLAESQSKGHERLLEVELLDRCGGKADTWVGNDKMAKSIKVHAKSIPALLNRLESRGKWKSVDDVRVGSRRRIIDLSHPHAEAAIEALRQSPHVRFERSRSNPNAIANTKKSGTPIRYYNSHGRVSAPDPPGSARLTPEGQRGLPKPFTVEPGNLNQQFNSRGRDVGTENEPTALESNSDGGTGGLNFSHAGTVNGKTGGPLSPIAQEVAPLPTENRLEVGNGAAAKCPQCGKPMELAGSRKQTRFLQCYGCGFARNPAESLQPVLCEAIATTPDRSVEPAPALHTEHSRAFDSGKWSIEQIRRRAAGELAIQPQDEIEVVRQFSSLSPGSTQADVAAVALAVATLLMDRHSLKNWNLVAELARFKKIPMSAFSGIAGPGNNPAALAMFRLKDEIEAAKADRQATGRRHATRKGGRK